MMMIFEKYCSNFASAVTLFLLLNVCHGVIVRTANGMIEGETYYTSPNGKLYYSFQSIPYAKPPLAELRFQAPQAVENWDGILPTKTDSPRCIQTNSQKVVGQEDCLYLNVYTPQISGDSENNLPVMVWIYGGGFMAGSSEYFNAAPDFFLDQDIVFVSINYRVGILGFLSLNDLIAPGNNGLKDQNLGLKWVKNNIKSFGGDPDQVTLIGQSAGAASVSYHLQSPLSAGLFNAAILESGTSFCLWSFSRLGSRAAADIAASFGVDANTTRAILSGLQEVEAVELHRVATEIQNTLLMATNPRDGFIFAPVIEPDHDGAFFTGKSYELLREGIFSRVPVLLGYNSMEASFSLPDIFRLFLLKYDRNPSDLVPFDMQIKSSIVKDAVGKEIKFKFFGFLPIALSNVKVMEYLSDDQFVRPIQQFARLVSQYTPTYFYEFHYEGNLGGLVNRTTPGVAHSEELGYLFRRNVTANEFDDLMRRRMVKMWTNFVKFRNPTPEPEELLQNQRWLSVSPFNNDFDYLRIDSDLVPLVNPRKETMNFWTELYNRYGEPPYDTY